MLQWILAMALAFAYPFHTNHPGSHDKHVIVMDDSGGDTGGDTGRIPPTGPPH